MDFRGVMAIVFEIPLFFDSPCMYIHHSIDANKNQELRNSIQWRVCRTNCSRAAGLHGLGWQREKVKWILSSARQLAPGYRRHLSWPQRSSILEQGPSICNHTISMLGHGSRVTTLYIWTWFTWDIMSTSPVCNHIYCHLWAECWSPSYASFPPPWPSITPQPAPRSSTPDIYTDTHLTLDTGWWH